jgi:hypothetical protein
LSEGLSNQDSEKDQEDSTEEVSLSTTTGADTDIQEQSGTQPKMPSDGIKGTNVHSIPDPLDPSTRAALEIEDANYEVEEFDGKCIQCNRLLVHGRFAVKCSVCGSIVHQFCFDGHVLKSHRPSGVTGLIKKTGNPEVWLYKVKKEEEE